MVVNFILDQRYQWFGSKLRHPEITTDTLSLQLDKKGKLDREYALPFLYSMSTKLVHSPYILNITVSQERFRPEIKRIIYFFEPKIIMDEETKLYLIENGFALPKGLTDDRFSIKIDPKLKDNELVYQFVR